MNLCLLFACAVLIETFAAAATAAISNAPASQVPLSLAIVVRATDPGSKYLAADYARSLTHVLGGMERLSVLPRARVLKAEISDESPTAVGRTLHASHVLYALVHATEDAFVLNAELVESSSGQRLWHETIRARISEGAVIPGKVFRATAQALGRSAPPQSEREQSITTSSPAAWVAYLGGRPALETITEASLLESLGHFERALAADPSFVSARVGLATSHIALGYNFKNPRAHFVSARAALTPATRASAPLPEAVIADAVLKLYHERDWQAAAKGAHFATGHDPSAIETHACFLHCAQTLGNGEGGQQEVATAHRAQPASSAIRSELPCAAYYAGSFPEAERESRAALSAEPENPLLYWSLARSLTQQGKFESAQVELKTAQAKPGGDWTGILSEIAYLHGRQNRRADALQVVALLRERGKTEYVDPYLYAMAYAGLGEVAEVCRELEQAVANDSTWISNVALDPKFFTLRNEPRFQALLRTLKLPVK